MEIDCWRQYHTFYCSTEIIRKSKTFQVLRLGQFEVMVFNDVILPLLMALASVSAIVSNNFWPKDMDENTWPLYIYKTVAASIGSNVECSEMCVIQKNKQCLSFVYQNGQCHLGTSQPLNNFLSPQTEAAKLFYRTGKVKLTHT